MNGFETCIFPSNNINNIMSIILTAEKELKKVVHRYYIYPSIYFVCMIYTFDVLDKKYDVKLLLFTMDPN